MSAMQAFHNWLSAKPETTNTYQRSLRRLTRLDRKQLLGLAGDLTWYLWDGDIAAGN
jgi:hypothetical protein